MLSYKIASQIQMVSCTLISTMSCFEVTLRGCIFLYIYERLSRNIVRTTMPKALQGRDLLFHGIIMTFHPQHVLS